MDRVVVDGSVAIKWFLTEDYTAEALRIRARYDSDDLVLLVPDLINAEVGNVIWAKRRSRILTTEEAQTAIDDFRTIEFELTPTSQLLNAAYHLAADHNITVYDAMYVALSLREGCRLVTADEDMVKNLGSAYMNVIFVANWS